MPIPDLTSWGNAVPSMGASGSDEQINMCSIALSVRCDPEGRDETSLGGVSGTMVTCG